MINRWLVAHQLNIECLGEYNRLDDLKVCNNGQTKFENDCVMRADNKDVFCLQGYIFNKNLFCDRSEEWSKAFSKSMVDDFERTLSMLRGAFCGFYYSGEDGLLRVFTDQIANKAIYYYVSGDKWMVGTHLDDMAAALKANDQKLTFNETAAQYMLSYGYMLDDSTFITEIRRVLPGEYVTIKEGQAIAERYYLIPNKEIEMTEEEAVERIDASFRQAVQREFEKDKEYGYRHLVDLSGGLDSRMTCWVAHSMGYTDQVNMTYSRSEYLDEEIARKVAGYLKHEYIFKMLDDAAWMKDIDDITSLNNGAALFLGITGGSRMLGLLNTEQFGIEHTGMIGDAILSTFYHDRDFNFGPPRLGFHRYSERLQYSFDEKILSKYPCQEMFAIYTRGILGAQSSYITRQHYVETSSPFMDVDFLETVFSIPFEYRDRHHIYLRWMKEKYPQATEFGWEKWGGIKPREDQIWKRRFRTLHRLLDMKAATLLGKSSIDNMTPVDYWYNKEPSIQMKFEQYYRGYVNSPMISDALRADIQKMYKEGTVMEKGMALTVLAEVKKYFTEEI